KEVMELMIPTKSSPTMGMKMTERWRMPSAILIKSAEAKKVTPKAKRSLIMVFSWGRRIKVPKMPSLAASSAPEVVGETNLFWVICCMTSPQMLIPTPVMISATVLGNRLKPSNTRASSPPSQRSDGERSPTPTKRETNPKSAVLRMSPKIPKGCLYLVMAVNFRCFPLWVDDQKNLFPLKK